jgi:hypothetical protein
MSRILTFAGLLAILTPLLVVAQQPIVRRDTQFPVELRTSLKTSSAKAGNSIEFHTTEAVLIGNNIVVPGNAKIFGHIEQVISDAPDSPRSSVRLRIDILKWKNNEAKLNAVVSSVEPSPVQDMVTRRRRNRIIEAPNFLKNIRIRAHLRRQAYTDFFSDEKNFNLRSGITLMLRQIDPDHDPAMMGTEPILDVGPQD